MTGLDVTNIVLLVTFFVIFGVFLFFDLFKRNEKYSFLAYVIVALPINFLWGLTSLDESISIFGKINSLTVFLVWFVLLDLCLLRDLIFVYRKNKEFDDILLFLLLGMFVQLIISAILPNAVPPLQDDTTQILVFFYLPDVHVYLADPGTRSIALAFNIVATVLILLAIIPLILDIKDEEVPLPIIVVISVIFYIPFLYLGFLWLPEAMFVMAFLMCVVLFILLLVITKSS